MNDGVRIEDLLFIDFEASSLGSGSFPIEIGIAWIENGVAKSEGSLIRPHPAWDELAWNMQSQAVHGISRADLKTAPEAEDVARWIIGRAQGRTLIADAPKHDRYWLGELVRTIGSTPAAINSFEAAAGEFFSGLALDHVFETLSRLKSPHRAEKDALRLARAMLRGVEISGRPEWGI
ncbi:hypothetical protein ACEUZ9_001138 [Paracoccus litorisediminis]|uniref:3'-5' exonuclease n=1 Tax=Paracoccus litorisediminis TaxID=2006130 RepID=UPI003731A173